MNATNGGILAGILLLLLLFFVTFFIYIKKARKKKHPSPTVHEISVIEPASVTNSSHFNNSVWVNDEDYQATVSENQNTRTEREKLHLTHTQEEMIKQQSKIFHKTYTKVLAEKQRAENVQSVIEDQKRILEGIKQNAVLAKQRTKDIQSVTDDENNIYEEIKHNPVGQQRAKGAQSAVEDQIYIYDEIKANRVEAMRRQFESRSFENATTSTQSTASSVNKFQPATKNMLRSVNNQQPKEYYKQPSHNPDFYYNM